MMDEASYRSWRIPKKNGKWRYIVAPNDNLKASQQDLCQRIPDDLIHRAAHGFRPGRSIYTNAKNHVASRFVLNIDIKNFFPSIKQQECINILSKLGLDKDIIDKAKSICFLSGSLPQGAPTSPVLANLYLHPFDVQIEKFSADNSLIYTRYADDLTFSGGDWLRENTGLVVSYVDTALARYGLSRNIFKTKLMPYYQRQEVTGLLVNGPKPRLSKKRRSTIYSLFKDREYRTLTEIELGIFNFVRDADSRAYNRICKLFTDYEEAKDSIMSNMPEYVSRIKFFKTSGNGAFEASGNFTVADSLAIKFTIFSNNGKMRVVLPSEKNDRFDPQRPVGKQNPKFYDQVYPISAEARTELENAIINKLITEREKLEGNTHDQTIPF